MNKSANEEHSDDPVVQLAEAGLRALKDSRNPEGWFQKFRRFMRWLLLVATLSYVVLLVLFLAGMEWYAERHWLLSFMLFVPSQMFLAPLCILTPLCLLFRPVLCLFHIGCVILMFGIYKDPNWSEQRAPHNATIKVMTNNYGQNGKHSPRLFIEAENPDIVVYQEGSSSDLFARSYTNYFNAVNGEFTIMSRFPIKSAREFSTPLQGNSKVAARYELDYKGKTIVVYSVHMPSPRAELESMKGIGFFAALAGREGHFGKKLRKQNEAFWAEQIELTRRLIEQIKTEKDPCFIMGDFNVPSHGVIYHLLAREFQDAFVAGGRGYGYSFPGATRNPITLFGPWLRLDRIYAVNGFDAIYCRVEPNRAAQHRAVVATLEFKTNP